MPAKKPPNSPTPTRPPLRRAEWVTEFRIAARLIRQDIGEKYASTVGLSRYEKLKSLDPAEAARLWCEEIKP